MCATKAAPKRQPAQPTIGQRLQTFIQHYAGKAGVGDTSENIGQCVGLVERWIDTLGLPHVWGNAKDLLDNADPARYGIIHNLPENYPAVGDIVVWSNTWGGGFGHTGIAVTANVMELTAFEQNDPDGSTPHIRRYTYAGVVGWLHPLVTL